MTKQIDFQLMSEIQKLSIKLFEVQDEDCPDGRVVKAKERAIWNRLAKITSDEKEQGKILDAINHGNWRTDDLSYKPICDELRKLGYENYLKENNEMKEMINKIQSLIDGEEKELKEIERVKRDVETRMDSDESLSFTTYHTLIHMLMEFDMRIRLHKTFIKQLKDVLSNEPTEGNQELKQSQNQFPKTLRNLRNEKGITQEELAKVINVNRMTIVQWEKGTSCPNYMILRKLADFFSVDVKYFYEEEI